MYDFTPVSTSLSCIPFSLPALARPLQPTRFLRLNVPLLPVILFSHCLYRYAPLYRSLPSTFSCGSLTMQRTCGFDLFHFWTSIRKNFFLSHYNLMTPLHVLSGIFHMVLKYLSTQNKILIFLVCIVIP